MNLLNLLMNLLLLLLVQTSPVLNYLSPLKLLI
jgi:hypothetical protein